jgi:hypothetical protein
MTQPKIELIAIDLDGTSLRHVGDDHFFSERVHAAVQAAMACGVRVSIATGRGVPATRVFWRQLSTNAPCICAQGGHIYDFATEQSLFSVTLARDLACELIGFEHKHPAWHAVLYRGEDVFISHRRYGDMFYDLVGLGPIVQPDLCAELQAHKPEPDKVLFILPAEETPRALQIMREFVGARANTVQSHALFVEVNPLGADKGSALARLAGMLGVAQTNVMAIGDQGNDATMVQWAGLGVAMGNANPITKAVANWVAPSVDEDGVAVAIEKFVLQT